MLVGIRSKLLELLLQGSLQVLQPLQLGVLDIPLRLLSVLLLFRRPQGLLGLLALLAELLRLRTQFLQQFPNLG